MLKPAESEEEFFANLDRYHPIQLQFYSATESMRLMHQQAVKLYASGELDEEALRRNFRAYIHQIGLVIKSLMAIGIDKFPAFALADFSRATVWTLTRFRKYLPQLKPTDDPIERFKTLFFEFKELIWSDSRDFALASKTADQVASSTQEVFDRLVKIHNNLNILSKEIISAVMSHYNYLQIPEERRPKTPVQAELCLEDRAAIKSIQGTCAEIRGACSEIKETSTETLAVSTQHNNRDRRDHGLSAEVKPTASKEYQREVSKLWLDCTMHPEWVNPKKGKRVTKEKAYLYLSKNNMLPKCIRSLNDFEKAIDAARK